MLSLQKNNPMKKLVLSFLISILFLVVHGQLPYHLYQHTFPLVDTQNEKVLEMLEQVSENQIIGDVEHLCSYLNRRADAIHIYNVKNWLVSQYENMNLDSVYLHEFEAIPYNDSVPFPTAPNVIGFQRGKTKPNEFIVCGAHYDSFVRTEGAFDPDTLVSPGADDNASGVAGILTTARILSNYEFERSIIYASWNAEEFGLLGSAAFARDCRADSLDIVAYFNLDMTGYVEPGYDICIHLLYTTCDTLLGNFTKQVGNVYLPGITIKRAYLQSGDTDYSSFNRNGYQAISPSEHVLRLSPYIHSVDDIIGLSLNSWEQSVTFTKLNLACVAHAAGIISESVDEIDYYDEEIVSFDVFDLFGRLVYAEKGILKNINEISVTNLQSGIYISRFFTVNGNSFSKKFFVKY